MGVLDTISAGVVAKTGRPDRIRETQQAIRDAMLEYHSLAFFERDITSGTLTIGQRDNGQADLRTYIPNLRQIMGVYLPTGVKLNKLAEVDSNEYPGYRSIGSHISINPTNLSTQYKIAYATVPTLEDSWIVKYYPDAMIALAAAKVAAIVGNRNLAAALFMEVGSVFPVRTGYKHQIMMENPSYEPDF
jgi:hypothetical protein